MAKGIDKDRSSVVNNVKVGKVIDGRFVTDVVDDKFMVVPQEVGMSEKAGHLLEFSSSIEGKKTSILSIDKNETKPNVYTINLPDLSLFKDADSNSIEGLLSESGLTSQLEITADENNNLNVQNDNGEIKFTIKAKSGKTYTITTNATGVNIRCEDDGKDYSFQAERESGVAIDMHTDIIKEFLDNNNSFCQTPQNFEDFPSQFLTLYATRQQASNEAEQLGDFTINSIGGFWDSKKESAQFPFVFFTKKDDPVPRLVLNGSLRRCESFYLQYDEKGVPKIVFKIKLTEGDKTPDYYAFDLKRDSDTNLTPESMAAIERIEKMGVKLERENQESTTTSYGNGETKYEFEHKDSKTYTKNYRVGINDRDLRIETADAQGGPAKQKRERRIQDTRSHALNTVTLVEKVGDEEHPIMRDGKPWIVKQEVGMSEKAEHLFEFWQNLDKEPTEEGGKPTTEKTSILSIDKNKDEAYSIALPNPNLFKDTEGKALPEGIFPLTVAPPASALSVVDRKGEMCFSILAQDNKTYEISTSAIGVKITCLDDGATYSYQTEKENGIGVDLHTDAIPEFLDEKNSFCNTPARLKDFPPQLINLYATRLQGNQKIKMSDYSFTAIDQGFWDQSKAKKNEATKHPFVFVTQESTGETFMSSNGYLRRCDSFYLQYDPDTKTPRIVFKLTAMGSYNTPQYYAFDLKTKDGKLTKETIDAINTISALPGVAFSQQNGRNIDNSLGFPFEEKDTKEYSSNFNVQVNNREYNQDGLIEQPPEDEDEVVLPPEDDINLVDPGPDGGGSGGGPGGDEPKKPGGDTPRVPPDGPGITNPPGDDGEPPIVENPGENPEPDEKGGGDDTPPVKPGDASLTEPNTPNLRPDPIGNIADPKKPKPKAKPKRTLIKGTEKDYSAIADSFGTAFAYLGVFIAIGALLTGFGILGIIGLAIAGAGTLTTTFSDKFKYTPYKVAVEKVKDFENQQAEDEEGAENFLSKEKDLSNATEQTHLAEKELQGTIATEFGPFKEAYDEYGVGFTNSPKPIGPDGNPTNPSRTSQMVGPDGLHIKQAMLAQLNLIQQAKTEEERNKHIEEFMDSTFKAMPAEKRQETIEKTFGLQTKPAEMSDEDYLKQTSESRQRLSTFISKLEKAVSTQEQEHAIQVEQEKNIGKARDRQLTKMFCSSRLTEKQSIALVERYAPTLARRLANDENFNREKVEKIFGKLSEEAQSQIYQTIINAGQQVSQSIDAIDRDAQDNRQYVANAHQAGEYIKTNGFANIQEDILNKEDNYFSKTEAISPIKRIIVEKTYQVHSKTKPPYSYIDRSVPNSPDVSAAKNISSILNADEGLTNLQSASNDLKKYLLTNFEDIFQTYLTDDAPETLLPNLDKVFNSGNVGTIENLANQLAKKDGDKRQKELYALLEKFNKAKNAIKNAGNALSPKVETLRTALEGNHILEDAGIEKKDFDKIVSRKVKEIEKISFVNEHLIKGMDKASAQRLLSDIASSMVLAEKAEENSEITPTDKKKYDGILSVLNGVVNGTLAESVIDNQVIMGIVGSRESSNENNLKDAVKVAKTHIAGYKEVIKLVDRLGLSTDILPGEEKSERQKFLDELNARAMTSEKKTNQILAEMINAQLGDKRIEPNGPTYRELLEASRDDKGKIDLRKANRIINREIDRLNSRAQVEAHCNDHNVGSDFATQELKRRKKHHNKSRVETKYDSVYDMIESLAVKAGKTSAEMRELVTNNPNWSAKKLADKLGLSQEYKKEIGKVSTTPIAESQKKEIWLLQKENKIFEAASDDFEAAWNDALAGKPESLKQFIESASRGKLKKDKKNKGTETEKKDNRTKAEIKELTSFYAEILESTGLNLDNLSKLLKGKDNASITATIAELNKREPVAKVEAMLDERKANLKHTELLAGATKTSRRAMEVADEAEQFMADKMSFDAKMDLLASLKNFGFTKKQVENAYQAFLRGDAKYFADTHIKINGEEKSLNTLLSEKTKGKCSFDGKEPTTLKRLGIKAKDLTKKRTRNKNLKNIKKRIAKLEKAIKKEDKVAKKKVNKTKKGTSAKIKNPRKMQDNITRMQVETAKTKAKTDVVVAQHKKEMEEELKRQQEELKRQEAEQKRAEEAAHTDERNANEDSEELES